MVFRRNDGRDRVFFVQHESSLPVFSFRNKSGLISNRLVKPGYYFDRVAENYFLCFWRDRLPPAGLEPATATTNIDKDLGKLTALSAAKSAALSGELLSDPDLAKVLDAWPRLPEHVKATILAIVQKEQE
jgi:hypothetical protein